VFDLVLQDAQRWVEPGRVALRSRITPTVLLKLLWRHRPLRAMVLFRFGSWFQRRGIPLVTWLVHRELQWRYGCELWVGADIGGGLYMPHPVGTVIAVRRMGRNCSVIAGVTLGLRGEWAFPDIGDEVYIGAGARVLGSIRVGDRARIGANAVVIDDVPDGATVVGVPAKVVKVDGVPTVDPSGGRMLVAARETTDSGGRP
jgi:serine O-acetyltransferase